MYQKGVEKMRRQVDSRTVWSLTAIRNGKQENADGIENAQFHYGRWQSEVAGSIPKRIPRGLIAIIGEYEMEQIALESGFVISMSASPIDSDGWTRFVSTITVREMDTNLFHDTRTLFSRDGGDGGTIEFVDLFNQCAGGMRMPNNIWIRVDELPLSSIGWAMSSGLMDGEKSRQIDLTQWIGKPKDNEIIPKDILALPGPPSRAYSFDDTY